MAADNVLDVLSLRRAMRVPWLLAAALLSLAFAALAGCGSGGSSGDEEALRAQLEKGGQKLARAKSLEASVLFEAQSDEETGVEKLGCIDIGIERGQGPVRVDLLTFDLGCEGGAEAHEVIIVGNRAWISRGPERWTEATVPKQVVDELGDEGGRFDQLLAAAESISGGEKSGDYATPNGGAILGPEFSFTAPSSSFGGGPGGEPIDLDVDFDVAATLDHQGYLRELVMTGGKEGVSVTVTATYEKIDEPQGIVAPPADEVSGPVVRVHSRQQLEDLLASAVS